MISLKFRAWLIYAQTGKYVYNDSGAFVFERDNIFFVDSYGDRYDVAPESIEQLVGYDSNGNEVYEGDEVVLVDAKGKKRIAETAVLHSWIENILNRIESDNRACKERGYDLDFKGCKLVLKNN